MNLKSDFFMLCRANLSGTFIVKIVHKKADDLESQFNTWVVRQVTIYKEKQVLSSFPTSHLILGTLYPYPYVIMYIHYVYVSQMY